MAEMITIEVCWVGFGRTIRQTISLSENSLIGEVRAHPDLSSELAVAWDQAAGFAVFGQKRSLHSSLEQGDRLEILRPLRADPKEARRQRAKLKVRPV